MNVVDWVQGIAKGHKRILIRVVHKAQSKRAKNTTKRIKHMKHMIPHSPKNKQLCLLDMFAIV